MKQFNIKTSTYIDPSKEKKKRNAKFKIDGIVRISKHKNIFAKRYTLKQSEKDFIIKRVRNTVSWTSVISDIIGEEFVRIFYKKKKKKKKPIKKNLQMQK